MRSRYQFLDDQSHIADPDQLGAIGARTTESQVHRELASGSVLPGGLQERHRWQRQIAVDAIKAASQRRHHFLSVTKGGHSAIVSTAGNGRLPHHPARRQAAQP
jgi:3-deoxy-7-phosphoheptulonate synthase